MKRKKTLGRHRSKRFRLLLYDRLMSRFRFPSLFLAVVSLGLWYGVKSQWLDWPNANKVSLLSSSGLFFTGYWIFTCISPILAYVQIMENHLRLQTPIYRINLPYKHIHNTRPVEVQKIFPPSKCSSSQRDFLRPFYGHTALAVDLKGLPPPSFFLRLFFHRFTFSPDTPGIVLLVEDWLGLSNELSSRIDTWRMDRSTHPTRGASDAADILNNYE
jgi:hypothetical protein